MVIVFCRAIILIIYSFLGFEVRGGIKEQLGSSYEPLLSYKKPPKREHINKSYERYCKNKSSKRNYKNQAYKGDFSQIICDLCLECDEETWKPLEYRSLFIKAPSFISVNYIENKKRKISIIPQIKYLDKYKECPRIGELKCCIRGKDINFSLCFDEEESYDLHFRTGNSLFNGQHTSPLMCDSSMSSKFSSTPSTAPRCFKFLMYHKEDINSQEPWCQVEYLRTYGSETSLIFISRVQLIITLYHDLMFKVSAHNKLLSNEQDQFLFSKEQVYDFPWGNFPGSNEAQKELDAIVKNADKDLDQLNTIGLDDSALEKSDYCIQDQEDDESSGIELKYVTDIGSESDSEDEE